MQRGFASPAASTLRRESNYPLAPAFRWLHWSNSHQQFGNVDPMSIDYAFRPCLRIRLTPGGRTCPGKPWNYGVGDSHPDFRYSCPHNHFLRSTVASAPASLPQERSPTIPRARRGIPVVGTALTPDHFRRGVTRLVSCYAMFK